MKGNRALFIYSSTEQPVLTSRGSVCSQRSFKHIFVSMIRDIIRKKKRLNEERRKMSSRIIYLVT
jgi:hypothetical protein